MQCEIFSGCNRVGFLRWERQGLYTRFYGEVHTSQVTRVLGVFEGGEISLGVPVPEQGKMVLRASMPTSRLPQGRLLRGRLQTHKNPWQDFPGGKLGGVLFPPGLRKGQMLRFPWHIGEKFPAEQVMLLYRYVEEDGQSYLELCLTPEDVPTPPQ